MVIHGENVTFVENYKGFDIEKLIKFEADRERRRVKVETYRIKKLGSLIEEEIEDIDLAKSWIDESID